MVHGQREVQERRMEERGVYRRENISLDQMGGPSTGPIFVVTRGFSKRLCCGGSLKVWSALSYHEVC